MQSSAAEGDERVHMVFVENDSFRTLRRLPTDAFRSIPRLPRETLPVAASDLVAWYPFRSGTGEDITAGDNRFGDTIDYSASVNGATFQASGGVTDIQTGANSGAFEFDGVDDDLQPQNDSGLNFGTDSFSISLAVKFDTLGDSEGIIEKQGSNGIYQIFNNDKDEIQFFAGDSSNVSSVSQVVSSTSFLRITAVRDSQSSEQRLFIDGKKSVSAASNLDVSNSDPLFFGFDSSTTERLNGVLDDIRFYNAALTQSQHDQIRSNTEP